MLRLRRLVTQILSVIFLTNVLFSAALFVILMFLGQYILSKRAAQHLSCRIAWILANEVAFVGSWLSNVKVILYSNGKDIDALQGGNYLVNMNHGYELDFYTGWLLSVVTDISYGAKVCLKEELKRVPILGKVWEGMGFIFLQRDWNKDRESLNRECAILNDYICPYVVLFFCEGTRFTEAKAECSNEYARNHGLKELKYHLIPRTRGFLHIMKSLTSSLSGFYDVTTRFIGAKPNLLNLISGEEMTVHCHIRRFELGTIPEDDVGRIAWLRKLYEEKDTLVDGFMKNGSFPGIKSEGLIPLPGLFISAAVLVFYTIPLISFGMSFVLSLPPVGLLICTIGIFLAGWAVFYKIWGYSRISKASSYGLVAPKKEN